MATAVEEVSANVSDLHASAVLLAWEIATALGDDGQIAEGKAVLHTGLKAAEATTSTQSGEWRAACGAYAVRYEANR